MQYRPFGKVDFRVSALGFGCMRLPILNGDYAQIDEPLALHMLRHAIDSGVNYVDTAYGYHRGNSERFVGRALQDGYRQKIGLATKLPQWLVKEQADFERLFTEQLERLQTDHIDFYLVHALTGELWTKVSQAGIREFLEAAKADGRIRHAGFSYHDEAPQFKPIVDGYDWSFCQIQYNFMDEEFQAGRAGLEYAAGKGLAVMVMEPLRGGGLTDRVPREVQAVWDKAEHKRRPAEWALRFVWNRPEVTVVLSGMSTAAQLEENVSLAREGAPNSLTAAELEIIGEAKKIYRSRIAVNCTNCGYCMPCPSGVQIPAYDHRMGERGDRGEHVFDLSVGDLPFRSGP